MRRSSVPATWMDGERSPWSSLVVAALGIHLGAAALAGLAVFCAGRSTEPMVVPVLPRVALAWMVVPPSREVEAVPIAPPCAGAACETVHGPEAIAGPSDALPGPARAGADPSEPHATAAAEPRRESAVARVPRSGTSRTAASAVPSTASPPAGPELPIAIEGDLTPTVPAGTGAGLEGDDGPPSESNPDSGEPASLLHALVLPGSPLVVTLGTRDPRYADYLGSLIRLLEPEWRTAFPRERALYMQQGEIVLEWTVDADGSVGEVRVLRPSGVAPFDRNVVDGFRRAALRFPRPPRDMPLPVTIRAPYRYRNPMFE